MDLEGKLVTLRAVEECDLAKKVEWLNDPEIHHNLHYEIPLSLAKTKTWFERAIVDPTRRDFTIMARNGESIGFVGLLHIDLHHRTAELYVVIGDKAYHGKGIAAEAESLVVQWAFKWLGLARIWGECRSTNMPAIKILERLGFSNEGTLRKHKFIAGRRVDVVMMGVLEEEFRPLFSKKQASVSRKEEHHVG